MNALRERRGCIFEDHQATRDLHMCGPILVLGCVVRNSADEERIADHERSTVALPVEIQNSMTVQRTIAARTHDRTHA